MTADDSACKPIGSPNSTPVAYKEDKVVDNTIKRRMNEVDQPIFMKLENIMKHFKYLSLNLDECTDVGHTIQLLTFAGIIDKDFVVHEEHVKMQSLNDDSRDSVIFVFLKSLANEYGWFEKCSCTVNDAAKAMAGSNRG
ncbi:SCAN domain-containing protein 3-like [Palaemon carinicauda]|uniref:SCAN domain-containing protein 3-like n=1 Tax=Palaemon carinicauda TaxID=392227 RepID=UPI0035B5DB61